MGIAESQHREYEAAPDGRGRAGEDDAGDRGRLRQEPHARCRDKGPWLEDAEMRDAAIGARRPSAAGTASSAGRRSAPRATTDRRARDDHRRVAEAVARPVVDRACEAEPVKLTRRGVLRASTACIALAAAWPSALRAGPQARGEPFDDGTFFDDGFGWTD